jgi:hypothetical protein
MALLTAVAYLLPLVVLPTRHALQVGGREHCTRCAEESPGGPAVLGECHPGGGPCENPRHHHHPGGAHHPDRCQVCQSLAKTPSGIVQVLASPMVTACFSLVMVTEDSGHDAEILTPLCRGPPAA